MFRSLPVEAVPYTRGGLGLLERIRIEIVSDSNADAAFTLRKNAVFPLDLDRTALCRRLAVYLFQR